MEKLLEVKDLSVSFKTFFGEVEAVRNISFDVGKSQTVAIVGESGCGKSVTANSIMQLLPMPPAFFKNGEILFNGTDLLKKSDKEMQAIRGNEISMVFQDPMTSLNPTMKIGKQIVEGLVKHQKLSKDDAKKKAIEMLNLVAVPQPEKRINQYPHEFSGGMRQRVMIALAMVSTPKLLIADEPTTALDVTVQAQILELMKEIQHKLSMSIILITHDLGIVADMSDKVIVMYAGQILEEGFTDEIFKDPKHPYTKKLLASVPRLDMSRNEPLHSIEGTPPDLYIPPKGCSFYDRCDYAMKICKEYMPEFDSHSGTHKSRCWLNHPMAKVSEGRES
ncbi:oligopeptide transport system ATP-binding protein [Tissierella praeacuta DSM 18095]|uniref:Oligopeptide transport system ATP-binding protein n=1 Tax=Tissierella praeacuta DSM 18095 TaxID=1123404 RepID=A0A1M4WKI3_9FIRM|nr:ABC transporter ATP-binding protein [Tissierella praeacuta]TCU79108.1 oligopeptide transport system ATP-binding protein [Tissierella praeacuta]SHE81704.1 oligopeptide transport system ATP-binding protein [Tissierella praeacuta DSM 18095]SUO99346.1 Glutathione import ATP-binding protein GsiA [Tissierella praeacuta]